MKSTRQTPTLSVVLTCYNGSRFIRQQLDSLAAQSLRPDELLVCNDGSTDNTLDIVTDFQRTAPFPVRIQRNPVRMGYADNFLHGCSLVAGDLIALCDQDDVWQPTKLERCVAAFATDPAVKLVIHSAEVVDGNLQSLGFCKPDFTVNEVLPRRGGEIDIRWPGFAMVVSSALIRQFDWHTRARDYQKTDHPFMAHDQWFFFLARSLGKVAQLSERLALYRQHGGNACGAATPSRPPIPTLARAANFAAYGARAQASAYYSEFLTGLAAQTPAAPSPALLASAGDYHHQADSYATRARLYRPDRTFGDGLSTYAMLWQRRAYRKRRSGGLGWRAAVKDAASLFLSEHPPVHRREETPH